MRQPGVPMGPHLIIQKRRNVTYEQNEFGDRVRKPFWPN